MNDLLKRAKEGTPIIEDGAATFVWRGKEAPHLIGDFCSWEAGTPLSLSQVAPKVWTHTLMLPGDAYIEYVFWRDGERLADPFNRHTTPNGYGHDNHFFYMPEAGPSSLILRKRRMPHGRVTRHVLEGSSFLVGGKRTVYLYRPPTLLNCPLLVVLDGQDYRRRAKLVNIVDNLIALRRIEPVAMAMVYHGGRARGVEYACNEATLGLLVRDVLPLAQAELNLLDLRTYPGAHGILGASLGGLMAFYAGVRAPKVFGRVLSQSGSFNISGYEPVLWDLLRHGRVQPLKIWMDAGRYEWLRQCNRDMYDLLNARGYEAAYREYNGGHNYPSWRDDLWRGLEWQFGTPQD